MHFVIDGYNVIRQDETLSMMEKRSLEAGREGLIAKMAEFKSSRPGMDVTIVFDGREEYAGMRQAPCPGVKVIFADGSADERIKRMIRTSETPGLLTVVTNDRELSGTAKNLGAAAIGVADFMQRVRPGKISRRHVPSRPPLSSVTEHQINKEMKRVWGIK